MKSNNFTIRYPSDSGFNHSCIQFFEGEPDLAALFSKDSSRRVFVTDSNVAELSSLQNFIGQFETFIKCEDEKSSLLSVSRTAGVSDSASGNILVVIKAGESFKTINSVLAIVKAALDANFDRNCIFTAIGGGVICDITGFAASMFKRGANLEFVPTTLLAMVDASLGGKTGCDFEGYKNMTGAFYPAQNIYMWPQFVQTLPPKEYKSGLAEAIKTALLFSKEMTELFKTNTVLVKARDRKLIQQIIKGCVKEKAHIVEKDFREKGERALLNFGHSFGHSLETVSGLGTISHGEAVAWGMVRALVTGVKLEVTELSYAEKIIDMLKEYGFETVTLPECVPHTEQTVNAIIDGMRKDKKNVDGKYRLILQKNICKNIITFVEEEKIKSALN